MNLFSGFIESLPTLLLSLPIVLLALSVHEAAHGYVAYKLGDPTARNLGRLTINPIKHLNPLGFLCMLLFRIGWAKPVPVNARNFKKPRRDMALTAAAGPTSNLILAMIFAGLLRLEMIAVETLYGTQLASIVLGYTAAPSGFKMLAILTYMLYLGVLLNISLAIFNLIPIPPFDGSRISHLLLPAKWYFKIMQYEQYIMIILFAILWFTADAWLSPATDWLSTIVMSIFGMGENSNVNNSLFGMIIYVMRSLTFNI